MTDDTTYNEIRRRDAALETANDLISKLYERIAELKTEATMLLEERNTAEGKLARIAAKAALWTGTEEMGLVNLLIEIEAIAKGDAP